MLQHSGIHRGNDRHYQGRKGLNLYNTINSPGTDAMSVSETLNTDNSNNSTSFILTDLQIGENFIVLLSSNGELFSSGSNEFGQLGIGDRKSVV